MQSIKQLALRLSALSVYGAVLNRPPLQHLHSLLWAAQDNAKAFAQAWGAFVAALLQENVQGNLAQAVEQAVLYDQNPFSLQAASAQGNLSAALTYAVKQDLATLCEIAQLTPQALLDGSPFAETLQELSLPQWKTGTLPAFLQSTPQQAVQICRQFYQTHGCGIFARYRAFIWRNHTIIPVAHPDQTSMADLKEYQEPRRTVIENTEAFLHGLPANNCLLYGDRGTGKSSTVKAVLNDYFSQGLRVIEMPKEFLMDFPDLVAKIADLPMKFIVFIDDLSFSQQDSTYASLKAVLEGGVAARPQNTLIYATSNRRHLVRETFSEREGDEIHRRDTMQETVSLADRFGLSVNFSMPSKTEYLAIIQALAEQRGLEEHLEQLKQGAEQWAIARGGRSPRCARQYMNAVEAKIKLAHKA